MSILDAWVKKDKDGKDGTKIYTTDVIVENLEFAESKNAGEATSAGDGFADMPDMDVIPFN